LVGLAIGASFILGLTFPRSLSAQGGLPERVVTNHAAAGGHELDPSRTYSQTVTELKDLYYGDLPTDTKLTYAAVRGLLKAVDDPYTAFLDPEEYKALHDDNEGEFVGI